MSRASKHIYHPHGAADTFQTVEDALDTLDTTLDAAALVTTTATFASNLSIANSVGSSALTISIKDAAGNDPSATSPVVVPFRNVTSSSSINTSLSVTAATSLVISSGSTLGTTNGAAFKLWIVGFNDGGTFRLGVINCVSGINICRLSHMAIASSTAEGGAGAADSAQVFYTGTAVTSKAYTILGYLIFESGQATAGTWAATATLAQIASQTTRLPGAVVQIVQTFTGAVATGTTTVPSDDTIPQNTEGNEYMSQAVTPVSAADLLIVEAFSAAHTNSATGRLTGALFQDTGADAIAVSANPVETIGRPYSLYLATCELAATTSSTTFKFRMGLNGAGTTTFNGSASARLYGGTVSSFMKITELSA